jgi:hypothetical protein
MAILEGASAAGRLIRKPSAAFSGTSEGRIRAARTADPKTIFGSIHSTKRLEMPRDDTNVLEICVTSSKDSAHRQSPRRNEALHLPPCQGRRLSDKRFGSCLEVQGLKTRGWRWLPVPVKRDVP